ncbi:MAG: XRE family transcriptional regulator [Proteobacteria bacterium]|nr:MAG: XRE family transcriptional regulator [Pseudomonadota bacterium]
MKNHVTKGSVFDEIFDKEEAADLNLRSQIILEIREFAKKRDLNQADLAGMLRVSQARVSDLLAGKIEKFSVSMLIKFVMRIGLHIEVNVKTSPTTKAAGLKDKLIKKKAKSA